MQPLENGGTWSKATTVAKLGNCSYMLQTEDGQTYRRKKSHSNYIQTTATKLRHTNWYKVDTEKGPAEKTNSPVEKTNSPVEKEPEQKVSPDNSDAPETDMMPPTVTSRGRVVKRPEKLKDYVRLYIHKLCKFQSIIASNRL